MRTAYAEGVRLSDLARRYGISRQRVEQIVKGYRSPASRRPSPSGKGRGRGFQARHYVYVVQVDRYIKIGVAVDVAARLRLITAWVPFPVELLAVFPGGRLVEHGLHQRFATARHRGEWYHRTPEIDAFLRGAGAQDADPTLQ